MPDIESIEREVDANYDAFLTQVGSLLEHHEEGHFALLRHQSIVKIFESAGDAVRYGRNSYEDRLFSVQEITPKILDMGYFSHGGPCTDV